ncbi:MAG TPA: hypothetical protein VN797_09675 [Gemmatimonadaceae bacterium]|nr:hypothetical protein [Gemmatimonadaceae bacterium]
MTDVLSPMLIPYARFLEVRARRRQSVTQLTQPDAERPTNVMVCSEDLEGQALAVMVVNTLRGTVKAAAVKEPGYDRRMKTIPDDIAIDEEQTAVIQIVDMKPVSS